MLSPIKTLALAALATSLLAAPAQTAPLHALSAGTGVTGIETVTPVLSPYGQLRRLLKRHYYRYPVTRLVREAAGDYDMVVFDRRGGEGPFQCSFITYRGERAMTCD